MNRSRKLDDDPSRRLAAVLSAAADDAGCKRLLASVEDVSPRIAIAALERLRELGEPADAGRLRELLFDLDFAVIPACVRTLVTLGDRRCLARAHTLLVRGTNDERTRAALVLRELASSASAKVLRGALDDPLANVRRLSLEALGELRDSTNLEAALQLTADPDPTVRLALVRVIKSLAAEPGPLLARFLEDPAASVRRELAQCSASLSPEAVGLLLGDVDADVRAETAWALNERPRSELVARVIERLEDADWRVRRAACRALGSARAQDALEPLLRRLLDRQRIVHDAAQRALAEIFGQELPHLLQHCARMSADARLRRVLVHAIGEVARADAVELVLPFAEDADSDVRLAVVHVLSERHAVADEVVAALARDRDVAVSHAARLALERSQG